MKPKRIRRINHPGIGNNPYLIKFAKLIDSAVNYVILAVLVILPAFAGYALWDSGRIYHTADSRQYEVYKPTSEADKKSFEELVALNGDVFAWLTVYGTNIDYPVVQAQDNMKYVNTGADGRFSLAGAIFLDYRNERSFTDKSSIIYGHHMTKKTMFGEIGGFRDKDVFDTHGYGNLYFDGENHGIEFFAFIHTDAYDGIILSPRTHGRADAESIDQPNVSIRSSVSQIEYTELLLSKAMHVKDVEILEDDCFILLTTCSPGTTNGRDILVGRLTEYRGVRVDTEITVLCDDGGYCTVVPIKLHGIFILIAGAMAVLYTWQRGRRETAVTRNLSHRMKILKNTGLDIEE